MEEVKKENAQETPKEEKLEKIRKNPWVMSTFVLGFLIVILLVSSLSGFGITGKVVSEKEAGQAILNFANAQGLNASVISTNKSGGFYLVTLSISGSEVPVYVTKDGKYFTSSLIPLTTETDNTDNTDNTPATTDVPKTDKPVVELFVMSYCPYGTQAEKGIIPAVELLGNKIDFKLRFVYYAMHPTSGEVEENLREYCIQKGQPDKLTTYLKCFLKAGDSAACLTESGIDKTKLNSCVAAADKEFQVSANKNDKTKWLSGNYPLFNVDKVLNEQYNIAGSPTLVINGVTVNSARDPASYLATICSAFSEGNVPSECSQTLSTTAYSAGFGYDTSASGSTGAQCG